MQRHTLSPRPKWQSIVESQGLTFHTPDALPPGARPYWDESACYEFTAAEIDQLEVAANELQGMCLAAAQNVIDNHRYTELEIPAEAVPLIEWAWNEEPPALYGRFDVLYNGTSSPKLLEYNADTPTSLLEAAVIQWYWLQDVYKEADQFNSLHEKLIAKWKDVDGYLQKPIYFASADNPEDRLTAAYLRDTAEQAGLSTRQMLMQEIGWNERRQCFVDGDLSEDQIRSIFKLYPGRPCSKSLSRPKHCERIKTCAGSNPSGSFCSPTRASSPSFGNFIPTTSYYSNRTSSPAPAVGGPLPAGCANPCTPAKAPT
jgi:glutathionylspermidine synthase